MSNPRRSVDNFFNDLRASEFDLGALQSGVGGGLDAFFEDEPEPITAYETPSKKASMRTKVASLAQLDGFVRTSAETLVHKSDHDLWSLQKDSTGDYFIERQFDAAGGPLKG